ncbi:methylmalonic aciduria type A protein, mitochondrial isoform X2 [Folsomia candida]|uniref:methylmalonic aciduria type A protein, mitochondrial isoform X2 n=1 Tax=Folsomia candida TaxID=158441 RepID=UPI000B90749B|nr:methylmalonic aciduria type A protein, mitochondrial isoform X2 [Folsomia candida]
MWWSIFGGCGPHWRIISSIVSQKFMRREDVKGQNEGRLKRLLGRVQGGDRGSLAEAITLVETTHAGKKLMAKEMLEAILIENSKKGETKSLRIGLSGPPGAGKSTFIEIFGKSLTKMGKKVAVLAVDPSSATTGGSLLGDKTRMPELTRDMNAYIRPSPARGHLGGVTRSTNEVILVCEYAGYDVIIVETVGVGQSEYAVSNMVDIFVVLIPPGGGDELQGVKRGIVERADILLVTKCDGDLKNAAHRTQYEYQSSLKFMRPSNPNWKTKVLGVSAKTSEGFDEFWQEILNYQKATEETFASKRAHQRVIWTWTHVQDGLQQFIMEDLDLKSKTDQLIHQVEGGLVNPGTAADKIISFFTSHLVNNSNSNSDKIN